LGHRLALIVAASAALTTSITVPALALAVGAQPSSGLCAASSGAANQTYGPRHGNLGDADAGSNSKAAAQGLAGEAYLVKDINTAGGSSPGYITPVGDIALFSAYGPGGQELWKTDGTELGTVRVKNIRAGTKSSNPSDLTAIGTLVYFTATDSSNDRELWVSDGTAIGTRRVANINLVGSSNPYYLTNVNGTLFFNANGLGGRELWKSDGTAAGTVRIKDLKAGPGSSDPYDMVAVGNLAFFAAENKSYQMLVYRSDGTAAGTYALPGQDPYDGAGDLMRVGNRAYFIAANDTGGCSLETSYFRTDGTDAGTFAVADELMEESPMVSFKNRFYFAYGHDLMRANSSESAGALVKRFADPSIFDDNQIVGLGTVGSTLYVMVDFSAYDGEFVPTDRQLWKSDGTKAGTTMVYSFGSPVSGNPTMSAVGGKLFFWSNDGDGYVDLWRSDGTAPGTVRVMDTLDWYGDQLIDVAGSGYFTLDDGTHGRELWRVGP